MPSACVLAFHLVIIPCTDDNSTLQVASNFLPHMYKLRAEPWLSSPIKYNAVDIPDSLIRSYDAAQLRCKCCTRAKVVSYMLLIVLGRESRRACMG